MVDIGFRITPGRGGVRFAGVHGPADGKLQADDTLVSINGHVIDINDPRAAMSVIGPAIQNPAVGTPIQLVVKRGDQNVNVQIDPVMSSHKVKTISDDPAATPAQITMRNGWLYTKMASVQ
jgi:hypothetical protein